MQVGESGISVASYATLGMVSVVEMEVLSLTVNLKSAREEAANIRAELYKLRAVSDLDEKEHEAEMIKVHNDWQGELNLLLETALQHEVAIANVFEETLAEVAKLRSEHDSATVHCDAVMVSIRRLVEARKNCKDRSADTLAKMRKVCGQ